MSRFLSPNKDVRQELALLVDQLHFEYMGLNGSGHHELEHPRHGVLTMANTPSDPNWRAAHRRYLGKMFGLTAWQLERKIAGQPIHRVQRPSKPKGESGEQIVKRHADRLGIPCGDDLAKWALRKFGTPKAAREAFRRMLAIEGGKPTPPPAPPSADPITADRRREWQEKQDAAIKARLGLDAA